MAAKRAGARDAAALLVIPSAKRLITSLRDLGYDFPAAVADLVDNSIGAGADEVHVDVEFEGDDSWVRIWDNGCGMTEGQLSEAMRYGAERAYTPEELGKFGLGLKTASLSQCRRLSVASRASRNGGAISAYCWDLAHVEETNRWEILRLTEGRLPPELKKPLQESTGTVVLWQRLDRILGYKHPYGPVARRRLGSMCRETEDHLSMVFHRFLGGEIPGRAVRIFVGENQVKAWDPFARAETATVKVAERSILLTQDETESRVELESFVLPPQDRFSTANAFARSSGPAKWNRQQGFYIYRGGRMIQSGGWCGLRTIDEHTKLARVALSFLPELDDAFKINVAKMRVQLPMQLRELLEPDVAHVIRLARETYGHGGKKASSGPKRPAVFDAPPRRPGTASDQSAPSATAGETPGAIEPARFDDKLWTVTQLERALQSVCDPAERRVVERVFSRFRARWR